MANFPCSGHARGEADEPVRKPLVRAVFAGVRRQDGGSPCGGRGANALPSVAASCDPPVGRDKRGLCGSLLFGL